MRARVTKRLVDGLKPAGTDYYVFDTDTIGFAVRVRATGGMSYIVQYKSGSGRGAPTRRVTLGAIGKMTPEQARKVAEKVLGSVAHGGDPAAAKTRERRSLPIADLIEAYLVDHAEAKRKASTAAWYRHGLERVVKSAFGAMKPDKVTRRDIAGLHSSLRDTPAQANRVLARIGTLYSWAAKAGYVPEGSDCRDGERVELHPPFFSCLLILTGARLREVLDAQWRHVDFERDVIFLPDSKTGKKPIYLSAAALAILTPLPRLEGNPFVIPGEKSGQPRADLKRPWAAVTKAAGLDGVRIHDLRHSFASVGASSSLGLPIIGKLLGHRQAATTQSRPRIRDRRRDKPRKAPSQ